MTQRTSTRIPRALLLAGLCASGCVDDCGGGGYYDPQPGPGELGNGEFHYYCITDDDPACLMAAGVGDFPARVAVGGRFRLTYSWDDASQPAPTLRSAVPERLKVDDELFTALATGYTAVLVVVGNSDIGDLIHIEATEPDTIAAQVGRVDYLDYQLAEGAEVRVDAIARDVDRYILAGALDYQFAIDDPTIAELVGGTGAHTVVRALAPGQTRLHITLGDLTTDVVLTVLETEGTSSSTGDASTGGSSTGDASTGGDGSTGGSTGEPGSTGGSTGGVL